MPQYVPGDGCAWLAPGAVSEHPSTTAAESRATVRITHPAHSGTSVSPRAECDTRIDVERSRMRRRPPRRTAWRPMKRRSPAGRWETRPHGWRRGTRLAVFAVIHACAPRIPTTVARAGARRGGHHHVDHGVGHLHRHGLRRHPLRFPGDAERRGPGDAVRGHRQYHDRLVGHGAVARPVDSAGDANLDPGLPAR